MIIDKILGKFGYIKPKEYEETIKECERWFSAYECKERNLKIAVECCEKLKKDIGALKKEYRLLEEENRILKSKYSDEVQKRFDLIKFLLESKIIEETEEPENAESEAEE